MLAPTALNQQRFNIVHNEKTSKARPGVGFFTKMDMGVVKYHLSSAVAGKTSTGGINPLGIAAAIILLF